MSSDRLSSASRRRLGRLPAGPAAPPPPLTAARAGRGGAGRGAEGREVFAGHAHPSLPSPAPRLPPPPNGCPARFPRFPPTAAPIGRALPALSPEGRSVLLRLPEGGTCFCPRGRQRSARASLGRSALHGGAVGLNNQ